MPDENNDSRNDVWSLSTEIERIHEKGQYTRYSAVLGLIGPRDPAQEGQIPDILLSSVFQGQGLRQRKGRYPISRFPWSARANRRRFSDVNLYEGFGTHNNKHDGASEPRLGPQACAACLIQIATKAGRA